MEKHLTPMEKILIVQTAFLGDVILITPLIKAIKKTYPDSSLSFLLIPETREVLANNPVLDEIIVYDKRDKEKGIADFFSLVKRIKSKGFNKAFIPHRSLRSALLCYLSRIPERTGFDTSAGSFLFTQKIKYQKNHHELKRNLSLLKNSTFKDQKCFLPELFPSRDNFDIVEYFLKHNKLNVDEKIVGIAPGSVWATKRWLPERFAQVADLLIEELQVRIVLLGSKEDEELCFKISDSMKTKPIIATGKMSILQSAALISKCKVIISNDSAPVHMAAAMGTPVVEIYGSTVPEFGFAAYGEENIIIEKPLYCRPCGIHGKNRCPEKHFRCMREITTQEVFEAVKSVIEKPD
jgi:heptosyltransferase-2